MTTRKERDEQAQQDLVQLEGLGSGVMQAQAARYGSRAEAWDDTPTKSFQAGWLACRQNDIAQDVLRIKVGSLQMDAAGEAMYELNRDAAHRAGHRMLDWGDLQPAARAFMVQQLRAALAVLAAAD